MTVPGRPPGSWTVSRASCRISILTRPWARHSRSSAPLGATWSRREHLWRAGDARHWREWLPDEFAAFDEPITFFAELGVWISDEVARIEFELLPPEYYSDDDFMARFGHRGMARLRSEEMVLHVALPAPDLSDNEDHMPDAWIEIGEAMISDVEDVVLPRRTPR